MKKIGNLFYLGLVLFMALSCKKEASQIELTEANISVSGTLNIVAKSYSDTITMLAVSGTIDARDFKTIRDSMPSLKFLDLSKVKVEAYSGTAGTEDANNDNYAADAIPQYAFCNSNGIGRTTLTTFKFPSTIVSIGDSSFNNCNAISALNIPSSVISIGDGAFANCTGFTGALNIPSSVATIGENSFQNCHGFIGSLIIPSSVTSIGAGAFYYCDGFTGSLIIPTSVTSIGNNAFQNCTGFNVVLTIGSTVNSVGAEAFENCTGLNGLLTIGPSVNSIGANAFENCNGITSISVLNPVPLTGTAMGTTVFSGDNSIQTLYVPSSSVNAYKAAPQWSSFNIVAN